MKKDDLYALAKDRPLESSEIYTPNDYYGHATVLKKYAGLPPRYSLKCSIEHGPSVDHHVWDNDLNAPLPGMIIFAKRRLPLLRARTNKALFAVGPIIQYSDLALSEEELASERRRLKKNLLVFPAHSTHWANSQYDVDSFCKQILSYAKDFDSVRVCLGWKDALRGMDKPFSRYGFECVTAGHMFDPLFHSRFKTMVTLAHAVFSNDMGSHIGYCIMHDKPVWIIPSQVEWNTNIKQIQEFYERHKEGVDRSRERIYSIFGERCDEITAEQREFVNKYWGADIRYSKDEMRIVFETLEEMFKKGHAFYLLHQNSMAAQAAEYLNNGFLNKALFVLERTLEAHPCMSSLYHGIAVANARMGKREDSADVLNRLLKSDPDNAEAKALLSFLEQQGSSPESPVLPEGLYERNKKSINYDSDVIIASYPRSGSTWIRLLISDCILQNQGEETDTVLPTHQDEIVPDMLVSDIPSLSDYKFHSLRLIKDHNEFQNLTKKAVYLFRMPSDTLSSYFHYHIRFPRAVIKTFEDQDDFCQYYLHHWILHAVSFINAKLERPDDIIFVSYRQLHEEPEKCLQDVLRFLDIPYNDDIIKRAVENHVFKKQREEEEKRPLSGEFFFRKGKIGSAAEELSEITLLSIKQYARPFYDFARNLCGRHNGDIRGLENLSSIYSILQNVWTKYPFAEYVGRLIARLAPFVPEQDEKTAGSVSGGRISSEEDVKRTEEVQAFIKEAVEALRSDNIKKAFLFLNRAKSVKLPVPGIDYTRAMLFLKSNDIYSAREAVLEELRYFPDSAEAQELLEDINRKLISFNNISLGNEEFRALYQAIRPYSMLSPERLFSLYSHARRICQSNLAGNFVECGVAAGGSSALLAYVIKKYTKIPRLLYAFDSFEGMPPPSEHDRHNGICANDSGWGEGTCAAPVESLKEICGKLGVSEIVRPVKGYFEKTLPASKNMVGMISFLHLDGDWYESTKTILDNLYGRIVNDGILQVDDFGHWEGCRKAIHEFEQKRGVKFGVNVIDGTGVWFPKPDRFSYNPAVPHSVCKVFEQLDPVPIGLQSQMSPNERFQLFYTAFELLPEKERIRVVEIGSFSGASLFLLYLTLKKRGLEFDGFSIEPAGTNQFYAVLQKVAPQFKHLRMFSSDAVSHVRRAIDADSILPYLIFVDGDHTYEGVRRDIMNYYPMLKPGGYMVFHDFLPPLNDENRPYIFAHHANTVPGIRRACEELMEGEYSAEPVDIPLLFPDDPTQTQPHLPVIPGVFSTLRAYRKPLNAKE